MDKKHKTIAIIGGGPSALFMLKRLLETDAKFDIHIFEQHDRLGVGMPYGKYGAEAEHVTNVSANEIPALGISLENWIALQPDGHLTAYGIERRGFSAYRVLPRLIFGEYLENSFNLLLKKAEKNNVSVNVHYNTTVTDITDEKASVRIVTGDLGNFNFDHVVICTGHNWPSDKENAQAGYFQSPYPPSKLKLRVNSSVAIKGASLTAVDAIRTLARVNGTFTERSDGFLTYNPLKESAKFKLVLHSRGGHLPSVRFHLDDSRLKNTSLLTWDELMAHREQNSGFVSLDYIFEMDFKRLLLEKDPEHYERIRDMNMEAFIADAMLLRETVDPFDLMRGEYAEAEKSIRRHTSVHWKELLAMLSFAMNYPAKYFSAEDMLRLNKNLKPLISLVIAFLPQSSCREMLALHQAGCLELFSVESDSYEEPMPDGGVRYYYGPSADPEYVDYPVFIDCTGQPQISIEKFPFPGLADAGTISPARLSFKDNAAAGLMLKDGIENIEQDSSGNYYLKVPGIGINDYFQVLDRFGAYNERVYMMAVPYMGGFNPDYSGLDFAEEASGRIVKGILNLDIAESHSETFTG